MNKSREIPIFKYKIGENIKDTKRNLIIIDKKSVKNEKGQNIKSYKYLCLTCGFNSEDYYKAGEYEEEFWILENKLQQGHGCSCCNGKIIAKGINDIATTHQNFIRYFVNIEDSYKNTYASNNKVLLKCIDCGFEKEMRIADFIKRGMSCLKCDDKIPLCEKFMFSVLEQLDLIFQTQLSKTTFEWCKDYRYDFYFELDNEKILIETHGLQHYKQQGRKGARTVEEEQLNDKLKKELALKNGIKEENYIVIDCRESTLKWIKDNIINNTKITNKFDLSNIDWLKCGEFALSNLVKVACGYKRDNPKLSTTEIGEIMKYSCVTIREWLKQGNELNWCNYDAEEEVSKTSSKNGKLRSIPIMCLNTSKIFESATEVERQSEELFGVKISRKYVSKICKGEKNDYKGFKFIYV